MTGYTTEEVARRLGLSPAQIRSYTRAGFLSPEPGSASSKGSALPSRIEIEKL